MNSNQLNTVLSPAQQKIQQSLIEVLTNTDWQPVQKIDGYQWAFQHKCGHVIARAPWPIINGAKPICEPCLNQDRTELLAAHGFDLLERIDTYHWQIRCQQCSATRPYQLQGVANKHRKPKCQSCLNIKRRKSFSAIGYTLKNHVAGHIWEIKHNQCGTQFKYKICTVTSRPNVVPYCPTCGHPKNIFANRR